MNEMFKRFLYTAREDLPGFIVLALASLCIGLLVNQFRAKPLPLAYLTKEARLKDAVEKLASVTPSKARETTPAKPPESAVEIQHITLDQFRVFAEDGESLILDARPEIFHRLGHIPGALALPRDEFESYYQRHREALEKNKARRLVIYCQGGSCEDSDLVSKALVRLGYTQIAIFTEGWNAWVAEKLPEERS